jgi:phage shock protein A
LLEVEKEHLREQIAKFNQGLASHAALCENLMSQVKRLEAEEQELRAKTSVHLRAGNREVAAQYALRLQTVSNELVENRKQLEQAEKTYKDLLKARDVSIASAKAKIDSLKRSIDDMKIQQAQAELTEMATGMISTIGGSGDTLDRLHEMVEGERAKAAGRARVARDSLDTDEFRLKESEQKALADQALADFAAKEGIALPSAPAAEAPVAAVPDASAPVTEAPAQPGVKTMGPSTGESEG